MWKWISIIVVVAFAGYSLYWYFDVYQPEQQAYANLHQAAQDANTQGQKIENIIQASGGATTENTPPSAYSAPASSAPQTGLQTVTVSNDSPEGSFTIQLPTSWKQLSGASWTNAGETYVALGVPPNDSKDLSQLSLSVQGYTGDPSTIDAELHNRITSALTGTTNVVLKSITVPGADEAVMGTATQVIKGTEFSYVEIVAYKAGDNFNSHTYTVEFSAESISPTTVAIKQAISTMKVLK
jgi:hypothetical protein